MKLFFIITTFIFSCLLLSWLSSRLIKSLIQIAKYLQWREFITAFFVVALATSLPNFFVDFNAVFRGMPEIAFGDIVGGNLVDLTLVLAIAVFFTKKGISTRSNMVQKSIIFTSAIAVLPLLLIWDGALQRYDGLILIFSFFLYSWWIFSSKERFEKVYKDNGVHPIASFRTFLLSLLKVAILLVLLLVASFSVVNSARFFADSLMVPLSLVGILIVGLGNAFPEIYFSVALARKKENWMVLGELMGSVIICSTLVLGAVAFIAPFEIKDFNPFLTARIFLIAAAIFAFIFIKSGRKISKKEGLMLLFIYITFLIVEIFIK